MISKGSKKCIVLSENMSGVFADFFCKKKVGFSCFKFIFWKSVLNSFFEKKNFVVPPPFILCKKIKIL